MQSPEPAKTRLVGRWEQIRPYAPFIAFVVGFLFDSITLGRRVTRLDLYLVSGYGALTLVGLVLRTVLADERAVRGATLAMQFALGGAMSALVVLYFKSTGQPLAFGFVVAMFATMVGNEYLHKDEAPQPAFVLALWGVAATMLANFVVPHIVGSISVLWFYVSALASGLVLVGMRFALKLPWRELRFAGGALVTLVLLWALGFVPPVPLIYKKNLVCTDFDKPAYSCRIDEPSLLQRVGLVDATVSTSGAVYCLTAVFAPKNIDVTMEHRWFQQTDDGWKQRDTMEFPMKGGRPEGWRFWSRKRNARPGWWKVETALKDGPVLGYEKFEVIDGDAAKAAAAL